jgi:hypothetical protein
MRWGTRGTGVRAAAEGSSGERSYDVRQALTYGLLIGLWLGGPLFAARRFLDYGQAGAIGQDAHAYWLTAHTSHLYSGHPGDHNAYLYSPLFAQIIRPIAELPFGWFTAVVIAVDAVCFTWLLAPLGWRWVFPLLCALSPEFVLGNVIGLITLGAVVALSGRAGFWAIGYLTKVGPGLLGTAWHTSRIEWRALLISWAWVLGASAISFAVWPRAWHDWLLFLHSSGDLWTTSRLVAAVALVVIGGRQGWRWIVPVSLVIGAPVFGQGTLGYLAGLVRLRSAEPADEAVPEGRRVSAAEVAPGTAAAEVAPGTAMVGIPFLRISSRGSRTSQERPH